MTVLVTGGAGFVGLAAAEAVLQQAGSVVIADREATSDLLDGTGDVRSHVIDVTNEDELAALIEAEGVRRVIHAAAITPPENDSRTGLKALFEVNVLGTIAVCGAARRHDVERVVLVSSGALHEGAQGVAAIDESAVPSPVSPYGISKQAAEIAARAVLEGSGTELKIARLGPIFGPFERVTTTRSQMSAIRQLVLRAAAGVQTSYWEDRAGDWLYSRDAGHALCNLALADGLADDIYLLSAGRGIPLDRAGAILAGMFPGWAASRVAHPQGADIVANSPRAPFACERAARDIGFAPRPLEEALPDYVAWLAATPWGGMPEGRQS